MAASGAIVDRPLAAAMALNAEMLPMAKAGYAFMAQILGEQATPLIFPSLALSAVAITEGLMAYQITQAAAKRSGAGS
jgi:hypothetical protein